MTDRAVVIGGGIIGAMCAWYLSHRGHSVTILDRGQFGNGCSHGNCGYVCPSHVLPLSAPGAIRRSLLTMLQRHSPLSIKPRFSPSMWNWFWNFARHCNKQDMLAAAEDRHALLQSSMQLYRDLIESESIDCEWESRGLLFVFSSAHEFEQYEQVDALLREKFGVAAQAYEGESLIQLETALKPGLAGGWHYEGDCHLRPDRLMSELRRKLEERGVQIVEKFDALEFRCEGQVARSAVGADDAIAGNLFVVAGGALTPRLNRALGCRLPIQPGKGYSITMPRPQRCPRIPMIFESERVAVTPLRNSYRIGSTMEFAGYDTTINRRRLSILRAAARRYLHEPLCEPVQEEWYGWRPMTWDGKPIIDRSPVLQNVWIAAGHNMLGLSMAPATGKLMAELIDRETPHVAPEPYAVSRFRR